MIKGAASATESIPDKSTNDNPEKPPAIAHELGGILEADAPLEEALKEFNIWLNQGNNFNKEFLFEILQSYCEEACHQSALLLNTASLWLEKEGNNFDANELYDFAVQLGDISSGVELFIQWIKKQDTQCEIAVLERLFRCFFIFKEGREELEDLEGNFQAIKPALVAWVGRNIEINQEQHPELPLDSITKTSLTYSFSEVYHSKLFTNLDKYFLNSELKLIAVEDFKIAEAIYETELNPHPGDSSSLDNPFSEPDVEIEGLDLVCVGGGHSDSTQNNAPSSNANSPAPSSNPSNPRNSLSLREEELLKAVFV